MEHPLRLPILDRYLFREITVPFFFTLVLFTLVLFFARSLKLIELVVNRNVPITDILLLFSYFLPGFLELATPMALLIGIVLAFSRLSAASELIAIRASGLHLGRLARPVMALSVGAWIFALMISCFLRPWANHQLGIAMFEMVKRQASAGLVEGIFNPFGALTIYAETLHNRGKMLENVLIADKKDAGEERIFLARHGEIISDDENRRLTLQLFDGSIHEGWGRDYNVTYFDANNIDLEHSQLLSEGEMREGKKDKEMFLPELHEAIGALASRSAALGRDDLKKLRKYRVEYYRRFTVPTACICVALLAMTLGVQPARGAHAFGTGFSVTLGVLVIVAYYLLTAFFSGLAEQGLGPAWLLCWIPNVLFLGLSVYFFRQIGSERWYGVSQAVSELAGQLRGRLRPSRAGGAS